MRKIILSAIVVFSYVFLFYAYKVVDKIPPVYACVEWGTPRCVDRDPVTGVCYEWVTPCLDNGGGRVCDAGYYACGTNYGQCCPVGCTPNWGACSQSCGGGSQSDGCGETRSCNNHSCCTNAAPAAPVLSAPASGAQVRVGVATTLDWNDTTSWGNACSGAGNSYQVCVSGNQTSCNLVNNVNTGAATQYSWTPTVGDATVTWNAVANNGALATNSVTRNLCVEGFSITDTAYVSNWSACSANHQHTRTCREDCGTDDCAATPLIEDCVGSIRGTLFDASDMNSCPGFDPVTGYVTGLATGLGAPSRSFGLSDQNVTAPHPWSPLTAATTNASGNYAVSVYAPSTYQYDFSPLRDIYWTDPGPKLTCTAPVAVVPSNPVTCQTQPCTLVNNISFGFWRIYGGWWQAVGGPVHGEQGISSIIPSSLLTEQSLLLSDTGPSSRVGFLSYGVPRPANMLGNNPNAKVSTPLWEKQSSYDGPVYDWSFYDKKFNTFPTTVWGDGQAVNYDDQGRGYQIFKATSSVGNFTFSPTGTQKVIFLVTGDVHITSDIIVPQGAFLAVIASGNIYFDYNMNTAEGWYIGGAINVPCEDTDGVVGCDKTDNQFFGNGTFIGWSGIYMTRDRELLNNYNPSEKFTYRRDLWTNAPDPMKVYTKLYKPFVP
jgi:hypothetical protein